MTDCHPSILKAGDRAYVNAIRTALPNNFPSVLADVLLSYANDVNVKLRGAIVRGVKKLGIAANWGSEFESHKRLKSLLSDFIKFRTFAVQDVAQNSNISIIADQMTSKHGPTVFNSIKALVHCLWSEGSLVSEFKSSDSKARADTRLMNVLEFEICDDIGQIEPIETAIDWQRTRYKGYVYTHRYSSENERREEGKPAYVGTIDARKDVPNGDAGIRPAKPRRAAKKVRA